MRTNGCPSPAELAKFLDGKLSASEARRLRVHVAECEACQEVVSEAMVFLEGEAGGESEEPMEAEAQPHPFPARGAVRPAVGEGSDSRVESTGGGLATPGRWLPLAAAVILALGLAAAWWLTSRPAGDLEALAGAQGEHRQTLVRLGDFPHAPPEPVQRSGSGGAEPAYALLAEAARLEAQADEDPTAAHLHALGLAHLMLGRYDDAVATLERAAEATGDPALERRIETDLAAALLEQGLETGQARTVARAHELLAELVEERPDPDLLFNAALALEELGARRSAIDTWDRYLEADPDSPWAEEARRRRDRLVEMEGAEPEESAESIEDRVLLDLLGQPEGISPAALEKATTLAEDYRKRFQDPWLAEAVGSLRRATGEDRTRLEELHRTYAVARTAKVESRIKDCLAANSAGLAHSGGEVSPVHLALTLVEGSCVFMEGSLIESSRRGAQVVAEGAERGFHVLAGQGAWLAGLAAHSGLRVGEALHYYTDSQRYLEASGDFQRQAVLESRLADLHHFAGRSSEAWDAALASFRHVGNEPKRLHQAAVAIADLAASHDLLRTYLVFLNEAVALSANVTPDHQAETWRKLGRLYGELGDAYAAQAAFSRGEEAVEAIADPAVRTRTQAFLDSDIAAFLVDRDPEAALGRIRSAATIGGRSAGLSYDLALTRSRAALMVGDLGAAERALADALDSVRLELAALDGLEQRASLLQVRSQVVRAYVRFLVSQSRDEEAWRVVMQSRREVLTSPVPPRLAVEQSSPRLSSVPSLTYLALDDELLIWRKDASGLSLWRVTIERPDLADLIETATRWIQGQEVAGGEAASAQLSTLLFPGDALRERRLVLAPDELVAQLAFHALPHPVHGDPLLLHLTTVVSPIPGSTRYPDSQPARDHRCLLLIEGAAVGGVDWPNLRRLRTIGDELADIGSLYSCRFHARSRSEVHAALQRGVGLIHYAGHVVEGPAGGLLLRDREGTSVISSDEIQRWSLAGTDVVLSACSGARSLMEGTDFASLAHAFLQSGASGVVASRWGVEDARSSRLATDLHRIYADGAELAESLRYAQAAARDRGEPIRNWAGWVAFG